MRFQFKELPGELGRERPVVPVALQSLPMAPQFALLDTGSLRNCFGSWLARTGGIDLSGADEETIALGGFRTLARTVPVGLSIGGFAWEAPVSFCDPWPLGFQVLGQEGFFRWFEVTIRAAELTIDLDPEDR